MLHVLCYLFALQKCIGSNQNNYLCDTVLFSILNTLTVETDVLKSSLSQQDRAWSDVASTPSDQALYCRLLNTSQHFRLDISSSFTHLYKGIWWFTFNYGLVSESSFNVGRYAIRSSATSVYLDQPVYMHILQLWSSALWLLINWNVIVEIRSCDVTAGLWGRALDEGRFACSKIF